jgi:hypothetical protein
MGRSSYSQSVSTSTRTFQTAPPAEAVPPKPKRAPIQIPKTLHLAIKLPAQRTPWLIVAVLSIASLFLFVQYREAQAKLKSPQAAAASTKQVTDTLAKVSKLVIVPTDEKPTVVSVADPAKLKGQTFFANARLGDKVIVYAKAKEAILYRPSTNQIVTMAPVSDTAQ